MIPLDLPRRVEIQADRWSFLEDNTVVMKLHGSHRASDECRNSVIAAGAIMQRHSKYGQMKVKQCVKMAKLAEILVYEWRKIIQQ